MNTDPITAGFEWQQTGEHSGYWSLFVSDDENEHSVEVCLEPTLHGGWLLAVYVHGELAHTKKLEVGALFAGGPLVQFDTPETVAEKAKQARAIVDQLANEAQEKGIY